MKLVVGEKHDYENWKGSILETFLEFRTIRIPIQGTQLIFFKTLWKGEKIQCNFGGRTQACGYEKKTNLNIEMSQFPEHNSEHLNYWESDARNKTFKTKSFSKKVFEWVHKGKIGVSGYGEIWFWKTETLWRSSGLSGFSWREQNKKILIEFSLTSLNFSIRILMEKIRTVVSVVYELENCNEWKLLALLLTMDY